MRWPWISRKRHDAVLDAAWVSCRVEIRTMRQLHGNKVEMLHGELSAARQDRIRAENESATLRGQLVAERHRQGLPAAVEGDAA